LIGGVCGTYGERRNECGVVVGKPETDDGLVNLGVNVRNLKGIGWKAVNWVRLAQGSNN
jgi:hypothetical protein